MADLFSQLERLLAKFDDAELGHGATEEELAGAEERLALRFEGTYLSFLRRFGWGSVEYIEIYGLGNGVPAYLDLVQVAESERHEMEPRLPLHLLPLRNDGGGNLYCLDTRVPNEPPVVFWDHEEPSSQTPGEVAASFAEWLMDYLVELR